MKKSGSRGTFLLLLIMCGYFFPATVWARLPKPVKCSGTVLAVDMESQTLVFKQVKGKKPLLLDWNKETEFSANGGTASAAGLRQGTLAVIVYRHVSFHNPLLKNVTWEETNEPK